MVDLTFKKSLFYFSVALLLLELIVYRDFIFGDNCFLFKDIASDSYNAFYTDFVYKINCLRNGQLPGWQFHTALGQNNYAFWLEPVSLSVGYLFRNNLPASIIWIQLCFTFLAGTFFFTFLRKNQVHYLAASLGAVLYAFCGYMIAGGTWAITLFPNEVMLLAFLLLSLTYFFNNKKPYLFPVALAFIGISFSPAILYFAFIVILVYIVFRFSSIKEFTYKSGRFVLYGIIGLGISCYLLICNVYKMLQSPRGSDMSGFGNQFSDKGFHVADDTLLTTTTLRLFSNNLQGIADSYKGWTNYLEAPFLYTGLIALLLVPQLLHFLNKRQGILTASLTALFLLIACFPLFRHAVWLFTGDYFRTWSLLFVLGILTAAGFSLHYIITFKKIYLKTLFSTLAILLFILVAARKGVHADNSVILSGIALIGYTALLFIWQRNGFKSSILHSLIGLIILELIVATNPTLIERKIVRVEKDIESGGLGDHTKTLLRQLQKSDSGFYRIEKDYFSGNGWFYSYNEALVQNFKGSASYFSFHNKNYIEFLKSIGAIEFDGEPGTRFVKGIREIPEAMQICSVKYLLSTKDSAEKQHPEFNLAKEEIGFKILKATNYMPFGFTYDCFIPESRAANLSTKERRELLQKAITLGDSYTDQLHGLRCFGLTDSVPSAHSYMSRTHFGSDQITGEIEVKKSEILFFSIPFDTGWKIEIDDKESEKILVFNGLTGVLVPEGKHQIHLNYTPPFKLMGKWISISSCILLLVILFYDSRKIKNKPQWGN